MLLKEFLAHDNDIWWGVDADLYPIPFYGEDGNFDDAVQDDRLTGASAEYEQWVILLLILWFRDNHAHRPCALRFQEPRRLIVTRFNVWFFARRWQQDRCAVQGAVVILITSVELE